MAPGENAIFSKFPVIDGSEQRVRALVGEPSGTYFHHRDAGLVTLDTTGLPIDRLDVVTAHLGVASDQSKSLSQVQNIENGLIDQSAVTLMGGHYIGRGSAEAGTGHMDFWDSSGWNEHTDGLWPPHDHLHSKNLPAGFQQTQAYTDTSLDSSDHSPVIIDFVVIPEPSSAILALFGGVMLLRRRRASLG